MPVTHRTPTLAATSAAQIEAVLKVAICSGASEGRLIGEFLRDLRTDDADTLQSALDEILDWAQILKTRLDEIEKTV